MCGFTSRGDTSQQWPRLSRWTGRAPIPAILPPRTVSRGLHQTGWHLCPQLSRWFPPPLSAEEKCYREVYISDTLELDLCPEGRRDSGDSRGSGQRLPRHLSLLSADSHGSSHVSGVDPGEMSVDEPSGEGASCGSSLSPSSGDTAGDSGGCPKGDTQDLGPRAVSLRRGRTEVWGLRQEGPAGWRVVVAEASARRKPAGHTLL